MASNVNAREYPEYRAALQTQFYTYRGRNLFSNRFRTEWRGIRDRIGKMESVFRGRYLVKCQRLLNHAKYDHNNCYTVLSDELLFNGGSEVTGHHVLQENRVFIGIGYNLTNDISIETGYSNQFARHAHDGNFDSNNAFQVTLTFDNLTHS